MRTPRHPRNGFSSVGILRYGTDLSPPTSRVRRITGFPCASRAARATTHEALLWPPPAPEWTGNAPGLRCGRLFPPIPAGARWSISDPEPATVAAPSWQPQSRKARSVARAIRLRAPQSPPATQDRYPAHPMLARVCKHSPLVAEDRRRIHRLLARLEQPTGPGRYDPGADAARKRLPEWRDAPGG